MKRTYGNGFVYKTKRSKHWSMAISWTDADGKRHRETKTTNVPCYPDKVGQDGTTRPDNRGKTTAEQSLRVWRDELVREAADEAGSRPLSMNTRWDMWERSAGCRQ